MIEEQGSDKMISQAVKFPFVDKELSYSSGLITPYDEPQQNIKHTIQIGEQENEATKCYYLIRNLTKTPTNTQTATEGIMQFPVTACRQVLHDVLHLRECTFPWHSVTQDNAGVNGHY